MQPSHLNRTMESLGGLVGDWIFERDVTNHGSMTGKASVLPFDERYFLYSESGTFRLRSGDLLQFSKQYLFEPGDSRLSVWFYESPPRIFQLFHLTRHDDALSGRASHHCGNDRYDGEYLFKLPYLFGQVQHVSGPRKNYSIITKYRRP